MRLIVVSTFFMLSACVPAVVGTTAMVGGAASRTKGISGVIDDAGISSKVRSNLMSYDQKHKTNLTGEVGIAVQNGEVLLTGHVSHAHESMKVEQIVWEVFGVKQVVNQLQTQKPLTWGDTCRDSWITTKAKTQIMGAEDVRSLNYVIKTVGRVVYVMGIARNKRELDAVLRIVSRIKNVKKVVCLARFREEVY